MILLLYHIAKGLIWLLIIACLLAYIIGKYGNKIFHFNVDLYQHIQDITVKIIYYAVKIFFIFMIIILLILIGIGIKTIIDLPI